MKTQETKDQVEKLSVKELLKSPKGEKAVSVTTEMKSRETFLKERSEMPFNKDKWRINRMMLRSAHNQAKPLAKKREPSPA